MKSIIILTILFSLGSFAQTGEDYGKVAGGAFTLVSQYRLIKNVGSNYTHLASTMVGTALMAQGFMGTTENRKNAQAQLNDEVKQMNKLTASYLKAQTPVWDNGFQALAQKLDCEECSAEQSNYLFSKVFQLAYTAAENTEREITNEEIEIALNGSHTQKNEEALLNLYDTISFLNRI